MRSILAILAVFMFAAPLCAQAGDGAPKAVRIDDGGKEAYRSLHADTMGRLFVGGREAIFVYDPNGRGGFLSKRLVYRFPQASWIND